jgi:putative (di)nucleoside polyphosphate hydrolase
MTDFKDLPYRPCAGVMMINRDNHVFVGQRNDSRYDAWQMPQGGIDPGEDPQTAAIRELEEEAGVKPHLVTIIARTAQDYSYDLPDELIGKLWGGQYRGQKQAWFLVRFSGDDSDINIQTQHPEFQDWKWTPIETLVDEIVSFKRALYKQVVAEFLPHL